MANPTTYFGWVMPTTTDLVTDLPADFNVFGQGVDTSMQDLLGGTTGQVLSKASATNMDFTWANAASSGMTLITTATVSASAALNVNNCFTSTYSNYYITGWIYGTTTIELYMRLRASGADNTTADYARQSLQSLSTTTNSLRTTGATAWTIGANNSGTKKTYLNMTVFSPQLAESTAMLRNNNNDTNTAIELYFGAHWFNASTQFDGFSLYGGSGNSTAEIRVYGLAKA
jgi:hypothetical protein